MGKEKFNRFYRGDARSRFIQQCGRNVRGFGDFGVTIVMDSKFKEEYYSDKKNYPSWFQNAYDGITY